MVTTGPRQVGKTTLARALLQVPKVYIHDTGFVNGDEGVRFENAVAVMLLEHIHFTGETCGRETGLHCLRTEDGAETDVCLSLGDEVPHPAECKLADSAPPSGPGPVRYAVLRRLGRTTGSRAAPARSARAGECRADGRMARPARGMTCMRSVAETCRPFRARRPERFTEEFIA